MRLSGWALKEMTPFGFFYVQGGSYTGPLFKLRQSTLEKFRVGRIGTRTRVSGLRARSPLNHQTTLIYAYRSCNTWLCAVNSQNVYMHYPVSLAIVWLYCLHITIIPYIDLITDKISIIRVLNPDIDVISVMILCRRQERECHKIQEFGIQVHTLCLE